MNSSYWRSWIAATAWMLTGCVTLRAPDSEPFTSRELVRQGARAMEMGQHTTAEKLLRLAIESSPKDSAARHHLAELLWQQGDAQAALVQIEASARLDPRNASLAVRAGEMLLATGNTPRAHERANLAIGLDPRNPQAWALRGRASWYEQRPSQALADMHRSLRYAPEAQDVLLDMTAMYRHLGRQERSLATVQRLLDTYPPGEEPHQSLLLEGLALGELGRWHQAAESLTLACQREGAGADVYFRLAQAELQLGHAVAAASAAERALDADASHAQSRALLAQLDLLAEKPTKLR